MTKFEAPGIERMGFYDCLSCQKIKKTCTEKVVEEQEVALEQHFP